MGRPSGPRPANRGTVVAKASVLWGLEVQPPKGSFTPGDGGLFPVLRVFMNSVSMSSHSPAGQRANAIATASRLGLTVVSSLAASWP